MKTTLYAIIIGLSLTSGLEPTSAQDADKPTPKAPYLAPVPDYGHWMVKFKYDASALGAPDEAKNSGTSPNSTSTPAESATPDGYLISMETIKTGDLRGITQNFAGGTSKEYTCQGNWVLRSTPTGPKLGIATAVAPPFGFYTTGFIMLDGVTVNMSTFKETGLHNKEIAFHYKSGQTDVWIDPSTMLPMAVKKDGVEASYEFLTPPPRPFPIPKDQESLLQKEEGAYKATSSMR